MLKDGLFPLITWSAVVQWSLPYLTLSLRAPSMSNSHSIAFPKISRVVGHMPLVIDKHRSASRALSTNRPINGSRPTFSFSVGGQQPTQPIHNFTENPNFAGTHHGLHHQHKQRFLSTPDIGARQYGCWKVRDSSSVLSSSTTSQSPISPRLHCEACGFWSLTSLQEQEIVQRQEGPQEEGPRPFCPQGLVRH